MEMLKDVIKFFYEVREEFSRVIWPTKAELAGATMMVLLLVLFFAIYIGAVDYIVNGMVSKIFSMLRI